MDVTDLVCDDAYIDSFVTRTTYNAYIDSFVTRSTYNLR